MIKFSEEKVLLLHRILIEATGGTGGVRDIGLLDSALEAAYATFDGKELFPTKEEKAARLGIGLISNHAFVDGNKRIGMYVMLSFLEVNGVYIEATNEEVVKVGMSAAQGKLQYKDMLSWINEHKIN
ncbi:MAG: type II toxin-antitoxin system death-on-curing family toxin [Clostridia bacterium]|nr:type II toxin-antitoxin system death-on-curing family toxin [Clostridia bacterium]